MFGALCALKMSIELKLSKEEALVLFEFLSRFSEEDKLKIDHKAEEQTLWNLQGSLEELLAEPFSSDYNLLLEKARKSLTYE